MVAIADPWLLHGVHVAILEQAQAKNTPEIRRNIAATRSMENAIKIGISELKPAVSLDRRVSVAPMMDYTDARRFS